MRSFAVSELHLPDNASYQRYADLQRPAVVWNVMAAPALSLKPEDLVFPGGRLRRLPRLFRRGRGPRRGGRPQARGLDVQVYGVPAYSTLGWMNWAGGDPLLSTFVGYPEGELARLIFHELAHQVVYVQDDTPVQRVLRHRRRAPGRGALAGRQRLGQGPRGLRRAGRAARQFRALTLATRRELAGIYEENRLQPTTTGAALL